jgi:hypothetical protein
MHAGHAGSPLPPHGASEQKLAGLAHSYVLIGSAEPPLSFHTPMTQRSSE